MPKPKVWSYKELSVEEGLKPESKHFQYYWNVSKGKEKKWHYCVWIDDDTLTRFAKSKSFDEIASCYKEEWTKWMQKKIDQGEFGNWLLRYQKSGREEINLDNLPEKLEPR